MKFVLILSALMILGHHTLHAQDLEGCKNPCKKTRIELSGPVIGLRTLSLPDSQYVRVVEVVKHGASAKNGILLNDTLTHFNGKVIQNMNYFIGEVAKLQPGDTITLTANRSGIETVYRFPLGALHSKRITEIVCCDEPEPEPELEFNNIVFVLSLNPAKDILRVSSDEVIQSGVKLEIIDSNGEVLKSEKTKISDDPFETNINIGDIPNGVYFMKIYVQDSKYVKRFVKEN